MCEYMCAYSGASIDASSSTGIESTTEEEEAVWDILGGGDDGGRDPWPWGIRGVLEEFSWDRKMDSAGVSSRPEWCWLKTKAEGSKPNPPSPPSPVS